jgi:hypothetical protein
MDKVKLGKYYNALTKIVDEFSIGYYEYKNGSNKTKRDAGKRKFDSALLRFDICVKGDNELYDFFTFEKGVGMGAAIYWDELSSFRYFGGDMPDHLARMKSELDE